VAWLIGADMLAMLPKWRQPLELMHEAQLVVMARPGWSFDWKGLPPEYQHLASQVVPAPLIDLSATDLRRRIAEGRSIRYLTPDSVCEYIRDRRLYR
jgi:nicotinate-nucleotide adenylyltransferase